MPDQHEPEDMPGTQADTPRCVPERCAYFLDLDGTLVEFARHPAAVNIDSDMRTLVAALHTAAQGALALISGRPIADIDRLFRPVRLPAAGQHGAERRDAAGGLHVHAVDLHSLDLLRASAATWRVEHPGLVTEDKGLSFALHFRQAPELMGAIGRLVHERLQSLGDAFQVLPGKMVLEVKPSGRDKGRAIREFLTEAPFSGRTPVFIGDDVTDEYGFAAVNAAGGTSIKVGEGPSGARWRLKDVAAVRRWLRDALAMGDGTKHD